MKKVLCINGNWEHRNFWKRLREEIFGKFDCDPIEGHIYTVEAEQDGYYDLVEFKDNCYRVEGFVPVSEASQREYKTAKISEPQLN